MHKVIGPIVPTGERIEQGIPDLNAARDEWTRSVQVTVPPSIVALATDPSLPTRPYLMPVSVEKEPPKLPLAETDDTENSNIFQSVGRVAVNLAQRLSAKRKKRSMDLLIAQADTTVPQIQLYKSWPEITDTVAGGLRLADPNNLLGPRLDSLGITPLQPVVDRSEDTPSSRYDPSKGIIIVDSKSLITNPKTTKEELKFSCIESLAGGTFSIESTGTDSEQPIQIQRTGVGFNKYDDEGKVLAGFEGLNGAIAMHLLANLETGNFDKFNPDDWPKDFVDSYLDADMADQLYFEHQRILAHVCDLSGGAITPRLFMDAYFQDTDQNGQSTARTELVRQFRLCFGEGFTMRDLEFMFLDAEDLSAEKIEHYKKEINLKTLFKGPTPKGQTLLTYPDLDLDILPAINNAANINNDGHTEEMPAIHTSDNNDTKTTKIFTAIRRFANKYIQTVNRISAEIKHIFLG